MSNMSYCRFQNTVPDLADCLENIYEELSPEEARARKRLIKLAFEVVEDFLTDEGLLDMEEVDALPVERDGDDEDDE